MLVGNTGLVVAVSPSFMCPARVWRLFVLVWPRSPPRVRGFEGQADGEDGAQVRQPRQRGDAGGEAESGGGEAGAGEPAPGGAGSEAAGGGVPGGAPPGGDGAQPVFPDVQELGEEVVGCAVLLAAQDSPVMSRLVSRMVPASERRPAGNGGLVVAVSAWVMCSARVWWLFVLV